MATIVCIAYRGKFLAKAEERVPLLVLHFSLYSLSSMSALTDSSSIFFIHGDVKCVNANMQRSKDLMLKCQILLPKFNTWEQVHLERENRLKLP